MESQHRQSAVHPLHDLREGERNGASHCKRFVFENTSPSDYKGEPVIAVGLLKGAMLFMTDLLRELCLPYKIEFMSLSSYEGTESTGKVLIRKDIEINPYRQHIIIIEDLIDTGTTLAFVRRHLELKGAKSVRIACLLSKSARRSTNVPVEYIGWECPDEFVIGYGMDFNGNSSPVTNP